MKTIRSHRFAVIGLASLTAATSASVLSPHASFFSFNYTDVAGKRLGIDASDDTGAGTSVGGGQQLQQQAQSGTDQAQQVQQEGGGSGGVSSEQQGDTGVDTREAKGTIVREPDEGPTGQKA